MTTAISPLLDRDIWLAERRRGVGASEAAAALGLSPFESPRSLYLRKRGELPDVEETEAMRWGSLLEPVIAAEYQRRTGHRLVDQQVFLSEPVRAGEKEGGLIFATLDGMTEGGWPVEFKTTSTWNARDIGEDGTDDLPEHWLIQVHQQMHLAGADRADIAVLIGGQRLEIRMVPRNVDLIVAMRPKLAAFWDCVTQVEPPSELHRADRRLMHLIYPNCSGEVDLTGEDAATVDRYQELGLTIRDTQELRESYKASILERLKNGEVGYLPDGRVLTRKIIEVQEQVVTRKSYSYVDLRVKKGTSHGQG